MIIISSISSTSSSSSSISTIRINVMCFIRIVIIISCFIISMSIMIIIIIAGQVAALKKALDLAERALGADHRQVIATLASPMVMNIRNSLQALWLCFSTLELRSAMFCKRSQRRHEDPPVVCKLSRLSHRSNRECAGGSHFAGHAKDPPME